MAAAAQQAQAIMQISSAVGQGTNMLSGIGLINSDGRVDPMGAIRQRKAGLEAAAADENGNTIAGTADLQQYWLRMCVYNGENLKLESTQVVVDIGEGTANSISIPGPDHPKSRRPVWEFTFEQLIEISGDPPPCEIKVFGKSLFPHLIGAAALTLPKVPTDGPRRVWLPLKNVPSDLPGILDPPDSRIQVVWQLCTSTIGEPDLVRVAEMDTMATEKQRFQVQMRLLRVKLKHGRDPPTNLRVKVDLLRKSEVADGEEAASESKLIVAGQRVSEPVMLAENPYTDPLTNQNNPQAAIAAPSPRASQASADEDEKEKPEAEWASWGRQGWTPDQFALRETQVNLLSYILQVTVQIQDEKKYMNLCVWQETVGNLLDSIESRHQILRFDAEMHTMRGSTVCAWARIEVDIHDGVQHKPPPPMLQDEEVAGPDQAVRLAAPSGIHTNRLRGAKAQEVPVRRGLLPEYIAKRGRTVKYYCTVYLDGIPMEGMDDASDPYVSVVMGPDKANTPTVENQSKNIFFAEPLLVSCKEADTKARIEVWNSNTTRLPLVGALGLDNLLGEAMIYDVEPNKTYWRYLYGGAHNAPRSDQAMQMNKGAIQPASTYHGTVVVHFGTKPRAPIEFQGNIKRSMQPYILTVRLYQGVYLQHYKGQAVTVLFQIAGCSLPVNPVRDRDALHGWDSNPYLLAFPGRVSHDGVLTFLSDSFADSTSILRKAEAKAPYWVERSVPKEIRMNGNVGDAPTHAYCYIVAVGAEDEAPQAFGRFRLNIDADEESLEAPRWKRIRFDRSVVHLPKASFKNDLAGFLLGSVIIKPVPKREEDSRSGSNLNRGATRGAETPSVGGPFSTSSLSLDVFGNRPMGNQALAIGPEQLLPRTSKPKSVMCRPCTGETFIHVASQGGDVDNMQAFDKYMLYCHIDVLCARNLVATDPNGLTDPVFSIQVGNKWYRSSETENTKTLNPTFMKRLCIPIEVSSDLEKPPVLIKLFDFDSAFDGGGHFAEGLQWLTSKVANTVGSVWGGEFVDVATVVVKADQTTDFDVSNTLENGKLDLDKHHTAYWHALDRHAFAEFDADEPGGCPPSFSQSPRMLLAVGFSKHREVKGTTFQWGQRKGAEEPVGPGVGDGGVRGFGRMSLAMIGMGSADSREAALSAIGWSNIETETKASYRINLDLLGLRNLTVGGLDLHVTSFWSGSATYNCGDEKNISFEEMPPRHASSEYEKKGEEDEKDLLQLLKVDLDNSGADMKAKQKKKKAAGAILGPLQISDFCGSRIVPPTYHVPVIGYLQKTVSKRRSEAGAGVGFERSASEERRRFLLMPDVLFQLKTNFGNVYGSLSYSIPQHTHETWAITCMKKEKETTASADRKNNVIRRAERINNAIVREDAYRVMMDCFASRTGYIKWNKEVMMGRGLRQQHIFSIYDADGDGKVKDGEDKGPFTAHFFNPGDFMASNDKFSDEPFDERVRPILRCAELKEGYWYSTREKNGHRPLSPEELYKDFKPFAEKALSSKDGAPKEGALPGFGMAIPGTTHKCLNSLETITTMQLRNRTAVAGWRALSHLHVPEPIPFDKACRGQSLGCPTYPDKLGNGLDGNLHTFVRPIGHRIDLQDRDSRFLARLRVGYPQTQKDMETPAERGKSKAKDREDECINFIIVKMDRPGVIIWAPPIDVFEFDSVRMPILFVVELTDGSKDIVPVSMPSFDLRFNFETMWYLRKTLVMRWQELRNRIERERVNKEKQKSKGDAAAQAMQPQGKSKMEQADVEVASGDIEEGGDITFADGDEEEDKMGEVDADFVPGNYFDGYSRSIYVTENAFVCRFLKRMKGLNFDRQQTENWYRATLSNAFEEVRELPQQNENDSTYVKNFFMERFMNLRKQMYLGADHKDSGMLKGHLTVTELKNVEEPPGKEVEVARIRPVENLWIKKAVTLNLYVLTARNLKLHGITNAGTFQPYLIIEIMGTDNIMITEPKEVTAQAAGVDFYIHYSANVLVPGATTLRVRLMQKRSLRKDLVMGETQIDIEDRAYCLLQAAVRQDVDLDYRKKYVQPAVPFEIEKPEKGAARKKAIGRSWTKIEPIRRHGKEGEGAQTFGDAYRVETLDLSRRYKLEPKLPPKQPAPIEAKPLLRQDEDTSAEIPVGSLRFWLDMTPSDESYIEAQLQDTSQINFKIVVTIWDVMDISIFRDYGERNDVYVQVVLTYRDMNGKVETQEWKTSVHKWAHTEASFNERKSFTVKAPVMSCTMSLLLFDDDIITQDDLIYDAKVVSLDHMLMLAFTSAREGRDPVGVNKDTVLFDSWPKDRNDMQFRKQTGINIPVKKKQKGPSPAKMRYDVQILPELEFNAMGLQDGVVAQQKGRLTWETALQNPKRFLLALFGPTCVRQSMCGACLAGVVLVLVLVTMVIFFLSSTFSNFRR